MTSHLVIPDTQVKPGAPTAHLCWIGQYIVDRKPDTIVHLGDHWDMASLSSYDKGKRAMEGRRYRADVDAGNAGLAMIDAPLARHNALAKRYHEKQYKPRKVLLRGNHEFRIIRATELDAALDGTIGYHDLESPGWEVHDFLEPVEIDGVVYAHYFYQPMSGRPFAGTIENRLKHVGHTFTMGHQQTLLYGVRFVRDRSQHGLVAGSCYLHDEDYKGPQGNAHWRGLIVKHEVEGGSYDPMFVSLDYLCRRYEGVSLAEFMEGHA
jgi:hypothetical protein